MLSTCEEADSPSVESGLVGGRHGLIEQSHPERTHARYTPHMCVFGKRAGPRGHESRKKTGLEDTIKKRPESK